MRQPFRNPRSQRSLYRLLSVLPALFILLSGCGAGSAALGESSSADMPSDSHILLESGSWPENSYTGVLPHPEAGRLENGWIDPERGYCYLSLSGVDDKAAEKYLEQLYAAGFWELERVSDEIRGQDYLYIGALLSNGKTELSLSHQQDHLGIYIHPVS